MTEWIKVEERLPEEYKKVIGYSKGWKDVEACYLSDIKDMEWRYNDGCEFPEVTHWMDMPEAPHD